MSKPSTPAKTCQICGAAVKPPRANCCGSKECVREHARRRRARWRERQMATPDGRVKLLDDRRRFADTPVARAKKRVRDSIWQSKPANIVKKRCKDIRRCANRSKCRFEAELLLAQLEQRLEGK